MKTLRITASKAIAHFIMFNHFKKKKEKMVIYTRSVNFLKQDEASQM